jgi:hypothetical protein
MALGSWADSAVHLYYEEVQPLHTLVGRASPGLDRIPKNGIEGGDTGMFFTLAGGMGIAGDLSFAQEVANQSGTNGPGTAPGAATYDGEWQVPNGKIETSLRVRYEDLVKGKTNRGAYIRQLTHQTDRHVEAFGERASQVVWGGAGYAVATTVAVVTATGVCTLSTPAEIANIHRGMVLVASANSGGTITDTMLPSNIAPARGYVRSVDRDAGTFVVSALNQDGTAGAPAGWGVNPTVFLFPLGQFRPTLQGATQDRKLLIQPISAWLTPTIAVDTFGTVDRSRDSALSGVRVPTTAPPTGTGGLPIEQKLQFAEVYMQSRYACTKAHTWVLQSERWFECARSLQAQGLLDLGATLQAGTRSFTLVGINGPMEVVAEPHQDPTFAYGLIMDEIEIRHLDGFPGVANADGLEMLRQADSNDLEFRLIAFAKLLVREPWRHCRVTL